MSKGFAIIYVVLITGLITVIVIALGFIFAARIKISTESNYSLRAIYAADTGLEWKLYELRIASTGKPTMGNNSDFTVDCPPPDGNVCDFSSTRIRSIGRYPGTGSVRIIRRALEVTDFQ